MNDWNVDNPSLAARAAMAARSEVEQLREDRDRLLQSLSEADDRIAELEGRGESVEAVAELFIDEEGEERLQWLTGRSFPDGTRFHATPPTNGAGPDKDVYWHFEGSEQDNLDTLHNDVQVVISAGTLKGLLDGSPTTGTGGVPEGWLRCAGCGTREVEIVQQCQNSVCESYGGDVTLYEGWEKSTTPGNGEWKPYYKHPEIGKPVLGYHPDWVDEDFCADGIRECFTFGDGSEWQSAKWDGYADLWVVEDGAPTFWTDHPQPPKDNIRCKICGDFAYECDVCGGKQPKDKQEGEGDE